MRPFVLIAALGRTGSTLTAEALTELPRAFVFREPLLFLGRVRLQPADLERLAKAGAAGLADVGDGRTAVAPEEAARRFRERVALPLSGVVEQVGIKEIRYGPGWRAVLDELALAAPVRIVGLGRDPRDIYLSLAHRAKVRPISRIPGPFGPQAVADNLRGDFVIQREVIEATGALRVRYEDLCRDPAVLRDLRAFVDSPVTGDGAIGMFKGDNRVVHGRVITERRVERWRTERDAGLVAAAHETMELLEDYCRFWGYS
jgi:hypothetical protein